MVEMTAGIVFPEGDVEALVRALEGLMADPAAAARTAEEGRRRVVEALSPQAVAEALFGILSEAAQARGR
jgi:mannosyltransferase